MILAHYRFSSVFFPLFLLLSLLSRATIKTPEYLKYNLMLQVLVPTTVAVAHKPMLPKKEPMIRAKDTDDSGGPTTTVFVGNISEKASDATDA